MSTSDAAALGADRVSIRYGRTRVLEDVSFSVEPGTVFALLGRNGVGKSSLVRCLLGQQKPTLGSARLFGRDAWPTRTQAMQRVGVVPEDPDAPPGMTAAELGLFCRRLYPRWDEAAVATRLARTSVPLHLPFGRLSKGEKGAVMLALALGHRPELLVLDDPTLGLDVVARKTLYEEIIGELADRGTTVFVTSHDLDGIERLADRVAFLKDERLLLDEPLEQLKSRFRRVRVPGVPTQGVAWEPLAPVTLTPRDWGVDAIVGNYSEDRFEEFRARCGASGLEVAGLSLEEIFIAVVGEREARS